MLQNIFLDNPGFLRVDHQPSFVLRSQPYRESSLLVDIYTRDYGRQKLIVRGAKGGKTAKASALQPFTWLTLSWQGKSELKNFISVESGGILLQRADALVAGMYLNELLFYLMREADPHEALFDLYGETLMHLEKGENWHPVLRHFELGLLEELGYAIDLGSDVDGEHILPDMRYRYSPESGFWLDNQVQGAIPGSAIIELSENGLASKTALKVAKILCRSHIDHLLAGRELKSRSWLVKH